MSTITITKDNFQEEVIESAKPVLLDFWAGWCGPCRMISPLIDEVAEEMSEVKVGKVNIDEQGELASAFNVMSIPTLVVMKDGKVLNKEIGAISKSQIISMLKESN
jgi:thioredoxin 1